MKKVNYTMLAAFGLLLLSAGTVKAQTARMQVIHNSPDYLIDTVDIWANNTRIANDLPFRKATQLIAIDSGDYVMTIAKKFSTDTTAATSLLKINSFRIDSGKTYLAFVAGVVDTTQYATNPAGDDRSLSLVAIDSYKSATTANNVELLFVNGTPDAASMDLNRIGAAATKVGDDIGYNDFSAPVVTASGNMLFNLTSSDSTKFEGVYLLNTASFVGKTAVVFTSGVYQAGGNPALAKTMKVYVAASDGSVKELVKLTGDVQIIHNSGDATADSVDVYVNGVKAITSMAFRTATPFITLNAKVPTTIAVAPKGSANAGAAFYTTTLTLDSNTNYYAIASGVINTAQYATNPNGKNTAFQLLVYSGARKTAIFSKNVDLLYLHGATDLQATTIIGNGQVQFLSKDDSYGGFHGYGSFSALDDIRFDIKDAAADTVLTSAFADLAFNQGKAGLVFMSGFKRIAANQNGDSAKLFIAWPTGKVDSVLSNWAVGLAEQLINSKSLSVYPNPASNDLHLTFEAKAVAAVTVELMDITGKIIAVRDMRTQTGMNTLDIDLSGCTTGLYLMNVKSNQEVLSTKVSVIK